MCDEIQFKGKIAPDFQSTHSAFALHMCCQDKDGNIIPTTNVQENPKPKPERFRLLKLDPLFVSPPPIFEAEIPEDWIVKVDPRKLQNEAALVRICTDESNMRARIDECEGILRSRIIARSQPPKPSEKRVAVPNGHVSVAVAETLVNRDENGSFTTRTRGPTILEMAGDSPIMCDNSTDYHHPVTIQIPHSTGRPININS